MSSPSHAPTLVNRLQRLVFRICRRLPVDDFDVRAMFPAGDEAQRATGRVTAALTLIREAAPIRYACLRRDLPRILIGATHNLGECHYPTGMCVLSFDYVVAADTTPEDIAFTLVHEGTHARLARAGFEFDEHLRARIERLCISTEILLARRFENAHTLLSDAQARLATNTDARWTNEAMLQRRLHALRGIGAVGRVAYWLGRAMTPFARARWRRAA